MRTHAAAWLRSSATVNGDRQRSGRPGRCRCPPGCDPRPPRSVTARACEQAHPVSVGPTETLRGSRIRHSSARLPKYPPGLDVCLWFRAVRSVLACLGGHPVTRVSVTPLGRSSVSIWTRQSAKNRCGPSLGTGVAVIRSQAGRPWAAGERARGHREFISATRYKIPSRTSLLRAKRLLGCTQGGRQPPLPEGDIT